MRDENNTRIPRIPGKTGKKDAYTLKAVKQLAQLVDWWLVASLITEWVVSPTPTPSKLAWASTPKLPQAKSLYNLES